MSKLVLTDLANLQNETTATSVVNANNALLEDALENTLSRDGTSPNTMGAILDMNSHQIINLPIAVSPTQAVRYSQISDIEAAVGTHFVLATPSAHTGAGDGIIDDRTAVSLTATYVGNSGTIFIENGKNYRVGSNITVLPNVKFMGGRITADNGVVVTLTNDVLKISDYLSVYADPTVALTQAFIRLATSSSANTLDLEGMRFLAGPIILNSANVGTFSTSKKIINGYIKADDTKNWSGVKALYDMEVTANTGGVGIQQWRFDNVVFDANNIAGLNPCRVFHYYHLYFFDCIFTFYNGSGVAGFVSDLKDSFGTALTGGSHGLIISNCRAIPDTSGSTTGTIGYLLYDGDVVVEGGHIDWPQYGIDAHNGSVHIDGVHFSMEAQDDDVTPTVASKDRIGLICRSPFQVVFTRCDYDGCRPVHFTNNGLDAAEGTPRILWTRLWVTNNDIAAGKGGAPVATGGDAGYGTITFEAIDGSAVTVNGFYVIGNGIGVTPSTPIQQILVSRPVTGPTSTFPSINVVWSHSESGGASAANSVGFNKIIAGNSTSGVWLSDAETALNFYSNSNLRAVLTANAIFRPGTTGATDLGSSGFRWGGIWGTTLNISGVFTGVSEALSGASTAASYTASGAIAAASEAITGASTAASYAATGQVSGATGVWTSSVQAVNFINGASGPTWTQGTGAPSANAPIGSIYSRTDGATATAVYYKIASGAGAANWKASGTYIEGSKTFDPPSVAAGSSTTTTVTVTGATLGDYVDVAFTLSLGGLSLSGYVSATDTVTCVFSNNTAGAIDLASGTLKARAKG